MNISSNKILDYDDNSSRVNETLDANVYDKNDSGKG